MNFAPANATPATNNTKKGFLNSVGLGGLFGSSNTNAANASVPPSVGGRRRKASKKVRKASKKVRKASKKVRKGSKKTRKGSRKH